MDRHTDLLSFYALLDELAERKGGPHSLRSTVSQPWPKRGVYFIFEPSEVRTDSGEGLRVVRVGTHALKPQSTSSLRARLAQHRGAMTSGGGNHRASVFRLLVGAALSAKTPSLAVATWGKGSSAPSAIRVAEFGLERRVSDFMEKMTVLALEITDEPGPKSQRAVIERNVIALLSNFGKPALDSPSAGWLGRQCPRARVQSSGLWNQNHVEESYDSGFLRIMHELIVKSSSSRAASQRGQSVNVAPTPTPRCEPPAKANFRSQPRHRSNSPDRIAAAIQSDLARTLFLVPCCRRKRDGGAPDAPRTGIVDHVSESLGRQLREARKEVLGLATLKSRKLMPAIERYQGGFYRVARQHLIEPMSAACTS